MELTANSAKGISSRSVGNKLMNTDEGTEREAKLKMIVDRMYK